MFRVQEHFYAAGDPRLPFDKAGSFERYHHLVNRGRADPKILLQVGFGRRPAMRREGAVLAMRRSSFAISERSIKNDLGISP